LVLPGCYTDPNQDRWGDGFIAPQEMMRLQHQPLMKEILSSLSSGYDEPNEEFPDARDVIASDLDVNAADYVIGRNDLLQITLTDVTPGVETAKTSRVSESGNVSLPLIGQIQASGLTEAQLERAIQQKYQDQGIVKNATVSVTVLEARQRTFQIRGAVQRPGQYAIVQADFRMIDALVLAGDVTVPSIEFAYIIRPPVNKAATSQPVTQPSTPEPVTPGNGGNLLEPKPALDKTPPPAEHTETAPAISGPRPTGTATLEDTTKPTADADKSAPVYVNGNQPIDATQPTSAPTTAGTMPTTAPGSFTFNAPLPADMSTIIKIPLRQLLNGDLKYNVVIRPQDTIVVPIPEAGEFYMGGHVQRVGVYSLTGRQITLKQAIISAGMLDELAVPERTEIVRRLGRDKEIYVRVNLAKVFRGQQPDVFLKPYDQVMVGTDFIAPFWAAIRNGFRITYGFGFLYDRNFYNAPNGQNGG
jgi:polysaccharide export outer membrane protein